MLLSVHERLYNFIEFGRAVADRFSFARHDLADFYPFRWVYLGNNIFGKKR